MAEVIDDVGRSGKDLRRPGVQAALGVLERGEADALVVAKLDRLSRSMLDFAAVMQKAQKQGWALVALDCAVDTTTPAGEAMANVLATFAQFERRLIAERTREALAATRAQGVRLGRRSTLPPAVRRRIQQARAEGLSLPKIAEQLNAEGVPTGQGGRRWYPSSVRPVLVSAGQATPLLTASRRHTLRSSAGAYGTRPREALRRRVRKR